MYGRLTSSAFSSSTTLRICLSCEHDALSGEVAATYVNGPEAGSMSGCHILVHSLNSICSRHLTVLLVHVVGTRAGVVSDPDTEVLDLHGALLVDLENG
jgi:hypothetical protein